MRKGLALCAVVVLLACGCTKQASAGSSGPATAPALRSAVRLELVISDDLAAVDGSLVLHFVNQETVPIDRVRFLLFPGLVGGSMTASACTVDGSPATLDGTGDGVRAIRLPRALAPDAAVDIALSWHAAVPALEGGGPFSRTSGFASLAWCFPVPVSPRTGTEMPVPWADFLCADTAAWQVRVSLSSRFVLLAAGTETSRMDVDGHTVVELSLDPARDFYLAVGSGLAERTSGGGSAGKPKIRCFAPPERKQAADFVLDVAGRAIEIFSRRFGPYPYGAFTVLTGPLPALGIEFPGLTLIGEGIFSLDGILNGTPMRTMLEATIAHEVAHQWFYNLVGNDQAVEPWLDEALAQYATRLYYLDRYGEGAAASYAESWQSRWNRVDGALTPIGLAASAYTAKEYGAIVYGRGPLFLETLASSMGIPASDRFLKAYVQRFSWRIAQGSDFRSAAEAECGCDLKALFHAWVDAR